ncbi:glutathionylspermidine synthase [Pacificibacter maritimus]|uniref:Glutathionylspermidine synthase n=1 Tax=Pacificibacter maritimus TaxID=762213 RepID=A0A3N4VFB3_9RHOB|nr:glutathionylspermidine synthase family protein [Pacificibacter maritimus]RPE71604.1 glutathionylspermidine synthase [Pacificibacter maritimus]
MKKIKLPERPNWRDQATELGFTFADMHGEPYWDETTAYQFSLRQIEEDIEDPATELHAMCRDAVDQIVKSEELLEKLGIPNAHFDLIRNSWAQGAPELYGRFDLAYDGSGPAKMLEYNADTPTSLFESASYQWTWLEDQLRLGVLRAGDDQFNGIHEALVTRFAQVFESGMDVHFTAAQGNAEDYATVEMLGWAAREAGLGAHYFDLEKLGVSQDGQFIDDQDRVIGTLFKLYPWEDMLEDEFAKHIQTSECDFIEPAWKAVLSNKGILPVLWSMFENHPNLLPAFFKSDIDQALQGTGGASPAVADLFARAQDQLTKAHVCKPIFSREGASISIFEGGGVTDKSSNSDYARHPQIVQAYQPLPEFDGFRPVIGAWMVGTACAGMSIREDKSRITQDLSRFKPHFIRD